MRTPLPDASPQQYPRALAARFWFTVLTIVTTVLLIGWGGFVTSIDAGLAVPDWPSSFYSYDLFSPFPEWWTLTPVLAEHGHRLLGALVGTFTVVLAVWTWFADSRRWMRWMGVAAFLLVSLQGLLGGLRVTLVSLDLAVIHACVAQIFFSGLVAMALFTSRRWLGMRSSAAGGEANHQLRQLSALTVAAVYGQIILGALLRHPGTGINLTLAIIHITGACIVTALVLYEAFVIHTRFPAVGPLVRARDVLLGILLTQFTLGFIAYFVLLDQRGMLRPSNLQVVINTSHLIIGAMLLAATAVTALLAFRTTSAEEVPTTVGEARLNALAPAT